LEEQVDVAGFLGALFLRHPVANLTIELLQTGLPQRVVDALQISHLPPKRNPAKLGVLLSYAEGDPPGCSYSHTSVFGMIGYYFLCCLTMCPFHQFLSKMGTREDRTIP
jgi:hypothetical protein